MNLLWVLQELNRLARPCFGSGSYPGLIRATRHLELLDEPTYDQREAGQEDRDGGDPAEDVDRPAVHLISHDLSRVGHKHSEQHEGRSRKSLHNAGEAQRLHEIEAKEIHREQPG